jgi:hypothetical protein
VIREKIILKLYLAQFLKSPALQEFCRSHSASTPAEVHMSLNNTDKIAAMIYKQRLLAYPAGQAFNGFLFEYERRPELRVSNLFGN